MGTIDKHLMEKAGARGCSNSDYNLVETTCCHSLLVEDDELHDIYFDPTNIRNVLDVMYADVCPICGSTTWDYIQLAEWPHQKTKWQWAYHEDQEMVKNWIENK